MISKIECNARCKGKSETEHSYTIVFGMDYSGENRIKSHDSHDVVLETSHKSVFDSYVIGKEYKMCVQELSK